jgi:hypothetical protein
MQKMLDFRLGQALRSGNPSEISTAYKDLADFHFEQRNMAAADELYAFSALHSKGIASSSSTITAGEEGGADLDDTNRNEWASQSTPRLEHDDTRSSASFAVNVSPRSSSQYPTPRGGNPCITLSVTVLEAQRLASLPVTSGPSQSLFCTVSLECPGKTSITARTDLVPHSDSPKWNARLEFRIDDLALHQGVVNVAIMSRRIFSPSVHTGDAAYSNKLELAVSRIGVVRSIRLYQIYTGNGTLQRWFTVSPAPEQEVGGNEARHSSKSCALALMLTTSDTKMFVGSRTSTPLLSPRSVLSPRGEDGLSQAFAAAEGGVKTVDRSHDDEHLRSPAFMGREPAAETPGKKVLTPDVGLMKRTLDRKPEGNYFESPAVIALTLNESFDQISTPPDTRRRFQDSLAENLASALSLAKRQILVFSLRRGSVIATVGIIVPGGGPSAQDLAAELQRQIEVCMRPPHVSTAAPPSPPKSVVEVLAHRDAELTFCDVSQSPGPQKRAHARRGDTKGDKGAAT